MKLSTKLVLSFSFVALLLAGVGLFSQYYNQQIKNQLVEESEQAILELTFSGEMGLELYQTLLNTQYFLDRRYSQSIQIDTTDNETSAERVRKSISSSFTDFEQSLDSTRKLLDRNTVENENYSVGHRSLNVILQQLQKRAQIYRSLIDELIKLSEEDYSDGREFLTVTVEPYFRENLIPLIKEVRESSRSNMDSEIAVLNERVEFASTMLAITTITALLLSIGLAFYIYQSIGSPLRKLTESTKQIGQGNLDERILIESNDEIGELAREFNRMAENLSKITFSKEYVDNIIESMADALVVTDSQFRIQRVNSATRNLLSYDEQELLGSSLDILFPEEVQQEVAKLKSEEIFQKIETRFATRTGEQIPVNLSRAVMQNADGSLKGLVCVASDITDRKKAEEQIKKSLREKEILLAEIHHRVKNNLAVISGMLEMQLWETENKAAKTVLRDSQLRVRSIALVHEKLYQSENLSYIEFDTYIKELLDAITSAYVNKEASIQIDTSMDTIAMNINQAIPCSLLINELVVNAYKHAFGKNGGIISIGMEERDGHIYISISDNGSGFPDEFKENRKKSLGMSIVNTLVKQLNAEINIYNDDGANIELNFKQEDVV